MQIPGQDSQAPRGPQFSRQENALNLCSRRISVNGEMCLGGPAGIPEECVFETVRDARLFRKSFNLCNKTASL